MFTVLLIFKHDLLTSSSRIWPLLPAVSLQAGYSCYTQAWHRTESPVVKHANLIASQLLCSPGETHLQRPLPPALHTHYKLQTASPSQARESTPQHPTRGLKASGLPPVRRTSRISRDSKEQCAWSVSARDQRPTLSEYMTEEAKGSRPEGQLYRRVHTQRTECRAEIASGRTAADGKAPHTLPSRRRTHP